MEFRPIFEAVFVIHFTRTFYTSWYISAVYPWIGVLECSKAVRSSVGVYFGHLFTGQCVCESPSMHGLVYLGAFNSRN